MQKAIVAAAIAALWAVCGGHAVAGGVEAQIKLFQFQPKALEVKAGDTVTWTNGDDIGHTVTAGKPGKPDAAFDSGALAKDGTFAVTFAKPGTYSYFCARHPSMTATVTVAE